MTDLRGAFLYLPEWRLIANKGLGPIWTVVLVMTLTIISYIGYALFMGLDLFEPDGEGLIPIDTGFWAALISSIMIGIGWLMLAFAPSVTLDRLAQLPSKDPMESKLIEAWQAAVTTPTRRRWLIYMTIGGFASGLLFSIGGIALTLPADVGAERWVIAGWFIIVVPFEFALISRTAYVSIVGNTVMSKLAGELMVVDPLNPDALSPLAQMALRGALEWVLSITVGLLMLLGQDIAVVPLIPLYLAGLVLAVRAFVSSMRSANRRLVGAKRDMIEKLNKAIAKERRLLLGGGTEGAEAGQRLTGLIAYRDLIERTREWPADLGTITKLVLYLAIPFTGWIGAALVEQGLEALMQ